MSSSSITLIEDDYEHSDSSLEYIMENVLSEEVLNGNDMESKLLRNEYNSTLINFCDCHENCDDCSKCLHGGNYIFNKHATPPEVLLNPTVKRDIFFECSDGCNCLNRKCSNRLVQKGPRRGLEIINSDVFKSKGLKTTRNIPKGAFISEYAGELLTSIEAKQRNLKNIIEAKMNYIICLKEAQQLGEGKRSNECRKTFVDPSQKGNIGRYLNHSCDPNCEIYSVRVDCPVPKLCIFSSRLIHAGEELCFHYGGSKDSCDNVITNERRVPCLCKSTNCSEFLPNIEF